MTAVAIDPLAEFVASRIEKIGNLFVKDIGFTPESVLAGGGGSSRSVLDFVSECARFNRFVTATIRGEATKEMRAAIREGTAPATLGEAQTDLKDSVDELVRHLRQLDAEAINRKVISHWGTRMTLAEFASMTSEHMMYHDGQLNYLQAMAGDGAVHWMD